MLPPTFRSSQYVVIELLRATHSLQTTPANAKGEKAAKDTYVDKSVADIPNNPTTAFLTIYFAIVGLSVLPLAAFPTGTFPSDLSAMTFGGTAGIEPLKT